MWKFQDFTISQFLCEINFVGSRSAKYAFSTHLEPLNLDVFKFLYFLKAEIYHSNKIQLLKMAKIALLELLHFPELISRKI